MSNKRKKYSPEFKAKGLIVQFRHTNWELDTDYTGFVLREEFNNKTHQYEIKKHRW